MGNTATGERANSVAETEDHLIQRGKDLIFEANLPELFPNLLNRIHFRRIRWDKEEADIIRDHKTFGFMPGGPVTAEQDQVVLELFGQRLQKNVGADSIAVWQY